MSKASQQIYANIDRYLMSKHLKKEYPDHVSVTAEQYQVLKAKWKGGIVPMYREVEIRPLKN